MLRIGNKEVVDLKVGARQAVAAYLGSELVWQKSTPSVPTARDYVQTGLIAMWDGIENAGLGVHDAAATTWKDLVGIKTVTLGNGSSFSDNALVLTGAGVSTGLGVSEEIVSMEFVESHFTRQGSMIFQVQSGRQCALIHNADTYTFSQNAEYSSIPYQFGVAHAVSVVLDASGAITKCCIDGVDVTDQRRKRSANVGYYGGTRIGGASDSYYLYAGSLYALRVYSRALTAAEIAANYAIDRQRFNLA